MCNRKGEEIIKEKAKELLPKVDKLLEFSNNTFDVKPDSIVFDGMKWVLS